jgi:hypothetical protein
LLVQHEKSLSRREAGNSSLLLFTIGDRALSRCAANRSNGLLQPAHQKRQEDTTDEFHLERNSCLVLFFSTCVPSVTNIVHQNLIQEQTTSLSCLTASLTPLFLILLVDSDYLGRWGPTPARRIQRYRSVRVSSRPTRVVFRCSVRRRVRLAATLRHTPSESSRPSHLLLRPAASC